MKKFIIFTFFILMTICSIAQYTSEPYERYVGLGKGKYPLTLEGISDAVNSLSRNNDSGVVYIAYPGVDTTGLGVISPGIHLLGWIRDPQTKTPKIPSSEPNEFHIGWQIGKFAPTAAGIQSAIDKAYAYKSDSTKPVVVFAPGVYDLDSNFIELKDGLIFRFEGAPKFTGKHVRGVITDDSNAVNVIFDGQYELENTSISTKLLELYNDLSNVIKSTTEITPFFFHVESNLFSPIDAGLYHWGGNGNLAPTLYPGKHRLLLPVTGTIKKAYISWFVDEGIIGTDEEISLYLKLNGTSETLIATVGNTAQYKEFININLDLTVAEGDFIEIKVVCPTWATNPTDVSMWGVIYIEEDPI